MKFELSFTNKEVTPITSIWCGVNRFLYTEVTRADKVLGKIFGWEKTLA